MDGFFSNRCWRIDCYRCSLPLPVLLNRLAAVLLVFIFGMVWSFRSGRLEGCVAGGVGRSGAEFSAGRFGGHWLGQRIASVGGRLLGRVSLVLASSSAFLSGARTIVMFRPSSRAWALDLADRPDHLGDLVEDLLTELRMGHLRPRNCIVTLTLWPSVTNSSTLRAFDVEVTPTDLRSVLHLLDRHVGRLPAGLLGRCFSSYWDFRKSMIRQTGGLARGPPRPDRGRGPRQLQRLGDGLDADLVPVRSDQADFPGADAVVDAVLFALVALRRGYDCSLLCNGRFLPVRWLFR